MGIYIVLAHVDIFSFWNDNVAMNSAETYDPTIQDSTEQAVGNLKSVLNREGDEPASEIINSAIEGKQFTPEQANIIEKRTKSGSERMARGFREAAELSEQDEIRAEMERLYEGAHPEEAKVRTGNRRFRAEREVMQRLENGRALRVSERTAVTREAERVAEFVSKFGVEEIDPEKVNNSVLMMKDSGAASVLNPGRAGALGDGENRFILVNPKLLKSGVMGRITIDHEFLHMYQSGNCPKALVEGVTCMYNEDAQKGVRRKLAASISTLLTPYAPATLATRIYKSITSEEAMSEMYFGGDTTRLMQEFGESVGSDRSLRRQMEIFQTSREMYKKMGPLVSQVGGIVPYLRDLGALGMASMDYIQATFRRYRPK